MNKAWRCKVYLAIILLLILAVAPCVLYSHSLLQQTVGQYERQNFRNLVVMMEDTVSNRYLGMLNREIVNVLYNKQQLLRSLTLTREHWERSMGKVSPEAEKTAFAQWRTQLEAYGMHLEVYDKGKGPLLGTPLMQALWQDDTRTDFKGTSLRSLLAPDNGTGGKGGKGAMSATGTISATGTAGAGSATGTAGATGEAGAGEAAFALFRLPQPGQEGPQPVLICFLPLAGNSRVLCLAMPIRMMQEDHDLYEQQIVNGMDEKFISLRLGSNKFFAILCGEGDVLLSKGELQNFSLESLPESVMHEAKAQHFVEYRKLPIAPDSVDYVANNSEEHLALLAEQDMLYQVAYFKPLDWYIIAATSTESMEAPARKLLRTLLLVSGAFGALCLLVAAWLTLRFTRATPLRCLAMLGLCSGLAFGSLGAAPAHAAHKAPVPSPSTSSTITATTGSTGTTGSTADIPAPKKWRIVYVEGGFYPVYSQVLAATVSSLESRGILKCGPIPDAAKENSRSLWAWLAQNVHSSRLEFVPDGFYSGAWDVEQNSQNQKALLQRIHKQADVDLILALGSVGGKMLANNRHHVPTLNMGGRDPVQAGIVRSAEDSGRDHIHAQYVPDSVARQIRLFWSIFKFKKLGVAYEDTPEGRAESGIETLQQLAQSLNFELVPCITGPKAPLEEHFEIFRLCMTDLSRTADAVYMTVPATLHEQQMKSLIQPLIDEGIPSFAQSSMEETRRGVLMSLSENSHDLEGTIGAESLLKIMNGAKARSLPQTFTTHQGLALNVEMAMRIGWQPPLEVLAAVDRIFLYIPDSSPKP